MKLSDLRKPFSLNLGPKHKVEPDLLMHYPIPFILRGINPRNLMGRGKWDELRRKVYRSNDYYCQACGATDCQVEAHEAYKYDFERHILTLEKMVPLCHNCHAFIHFDTLGPYLDKPVLDAGIAVLVDAGIAVPRIKWASSSKKIDEPELDDEWQERLSELYSFEWKLDLEGIEDAQEILIETYEERLVIDGG